MSERPRIHQEPIGHIQEMTGAIRAGRDLTPSSWPDQARVAVALSFDVDTETIGLWNGRHSPSYFSRGEYGARVSIPRILSILREMEAPATFFIPGVSGLLHPEVAPAILESGLHEIGLHGWIHESVVDIPEEEERALTRRACEYWSRELGRAPAGIRTPSWDFSPATLSIIRELELVYDSSLMADDRPYEIMAQGRPTGIVEFPVDWILDDYMYFQIDWDQHALPSVTPDDVFSIWQAEFDRALQEGTLFVLTMHPQVIGHRSRIGILERMIDYMQGHHAWFATLETIARYVKTETIV